MGKVHAELTNQITKQALVETQNTNQVFLYPFSSIVVNFIE